MKKERRNLISTRATSKKSLSQNLEALLLNYSSKKEKNCELSSFILITYQMRLESLPKMKRLPQSDTTNALLRQLTCLLQSKNPLSIKRQYYIMC